MNSKTYEVPIMLDPKGLMYDDIAKLNPFYEEYMTFWDDPADVSDSSLCSDGLSNSSSMHSLGSVSHPSLHPFELATSPLFHVHSRPESLFPKSPKVTFHDAGQCTPCYDECHDLESSQIAIMEVESCTEMCFSPACEATGFYDSGALPLDPVDHTLGRVRSSHKQLFGANGWLGCTAKLEKSSSSKAKYKSLKGLGKKFRQHVEEIAGDIAKAHPLPFHALRQPKVQPKSTVPISLDPTAQAKLYSEMEVMICVSANKFLVQQYDEGRMSQESIKKVNNFWGSKNRPEVVEFLFDQATQRQLILANIRTLHFNGQSSTNPVLLNSNLQNWKTVAKEMGVRTFCAPDSVIRKLMHDIQKLLDMLGAPIATFVAFEELQVRTLDFMKEQRAKSYFRESGRT